MNEPSYPLDEAGAATLKKWAGEWTGEHVAKLLRGSYSHPRYQHDVQAVADAHNAAVKQEVAAERRVSQALNMEVIELNEQLAAMRQPQRPELVEGQDTYRMGYVDGWGDHKDDRKYNPDERAAMSQARQEVKK